MDDHARKRRKITPEHLITKESSVVDHDLFLVMDEKLNKILTKLDNLELKSTKSSSESTNIIKNLEIGSSNQHREQTLEAPDISEKLYNCKTIENILDEFSEFELNENGNNLICKVCVRHSSPSEHGCGIISVKSSDSLSISETDIDKAKVSSDFRNVKKKLKVHLNGLIHNKSLEATANEEKINYAFVSRDHKIR